MTLIEQRYAWQKDYFALSKDAKVHALFAEQRCGKTRPILETAQHQYAQGNIDAVLVIAWPSEVPRVWVDEATKWLTIPHKAFQWRSNKASTKQYQKDFDALLAFKGLAILAINCEALRSDICRKAIMRFLKRKAMVIGDETSGWAIHPGTLQTKALLSIGKQPNVIMKRILDGTPVEDGPLNLYAPVTFLSPAILGHTSFWSYKNHYAEWEQKLNHTTNRMYPELKGYRNIDELIQRLAPHSFRILRKDCADLPEKIYVKEYVQLTEEQRRVYNDLRDEYQAELRDGRSVNASMVLTRYLRLQQVLSNRYPGQTTAEICAQCSGDGCPTCDGIGAKEVWIEETLIDKTNPRLDALERVLRKDRAPFIVWSRFTRDVDEIVAHAAKIGLDPARFDGTMTSEEKHLAIEDFQSGLCNCFVGNPKAGGRGIKLSRAKTIVYYANDFALLVRLQSEDRAESLDRQESTTIIDIVAEGTIDEHIVDTLRAKKSMADKITGDPAGAWL